MTQNSRSFRLSFVPSKHKSTPAERRARARKIRENRSQSGAQRIADIHGCAYKDEKDDLCGQPELSEFSASRLVTKVSLFN